MGKKDQRIDAYIKKSADFAKPVLTHFRKLMHQVCPNLDETIKWGFPHFDYQNGPLSSMASFKNHCAIGFWKAALMENSEELVGMAQSEVAMGHLGRITSLNDLPKDPVLKSYIVQGMKLNEQGIKLKPKISSSKKNEAELPLYFGNALSKNKNAGKTFENLSPSQKNDYIEWVTEAKTEATRNKRIATAIIWLSEGKKRNWKYL